MPTRVQASLVLIAAGIVIVCESHTVDRSLPPVAAPAWKSPAPDVPVPSVLVAELVSYDICNAHLDIGEYSEAVKCLDQKLSTTRRDADSAIASELALAYVGVGNEAQARRVLARWTSLSAIETEHTIELFRGVVAQHRKKSLK